MLILEIQQTTFKQTTNFPACKGLRNSYSIISNSDFDQSDPQILGLNAGMLYSKYHHSW